MDGKRQKVPTSVETIQEGPTVTKHPKLVLKPPKFITDRQKQDDLPTVSSILEDTLQLETAEDVVERLLRLLDSHKLESVLEQQGTWSPEEMGKCIGNIGKLAKTYRGDVSVCCVLVHVVEIFGMKLKSSSDGDCLPKNFQLFVLSLVDHGEYMCRVQ